MRAMQLVIVVKVFLVASAVLLVSAVKTPDELAALRAQNPHAYDVVQSLLLKNKMGVLNPRHPSVALSTYQEEEPRQTEVEDDEAFDSRRPSALLSAPQQEARQAKEALSTPQEEEPRQAEEDDDLQASGLPSMPEALDGRRPSALLSMAKQELRQANEDVALLSPAPATQGLSADWMSTRPGNEEDEVQGVMRRIEDLTGKPANRQQTFGMDLESNDLVGDAGKTPALPGSPPAPAFTHTDSQFSFHANPYLADLGLNSATTRLVGAQDQHVAPVVKETASYFADLGLNSATTGMVAAREQHEAPAAKEVAHVQPQHPDEAQVPFPFSSSQDAEEEAMFEEALGLVKAKNKVRREGKQSLQQHAASAPVETHPIKSSADPYYTALKLTKPQAVEADVVQDKSGALALARSGDHAKQDTEDQLRNSASQDSNFGNPYLEGIHLDIHNVQSHTAQLLKEASATGNPYLQGFDLDIHQARGANAARSLLRKPEQAMAQSQHSNKKPSHHWKDKLSRWLNS